MLDASAVELDREARVERLALCRSVSCPIYVLDSFFEEEVADRDDVHDRVWGDAAGELTPPAAPLGKGALLTYAIRLRIALKRACISAEAGNAAFDRLTAASKVTF